MKKALKSTGQILLGVVVLVIVAGFFLPDSTHVERSVVINAPQRQVFDFLNSYRNFNDWSPWAKLDPNAQYQFSGPQSGVGAKMSWRSDDPKVGQGYQEIIAVKEAEEIQVTLDFGDNGQASAFYRLQPADSGVRVTWGFDTEHGFNLFNRYIGLMLERLLAPMYEEGLQSLKQRIENPGAAS
ncbi:SRPBCC family protein [Hahella sp. NBU794]|uniref:SRPBCC family protein n=1 Tax=Hahella sp. NBU794 TaxID=3422590 RepID=UPI003D6F8826